LFGAWQLRDEERGPLRIVYLVESPFAVMHFHQLGFPAVSPLWLDGQSRAGGHHWRAGEGTCVPAGQEQTKRGQDLVDTLPAWLVRRFELLGAEPAQMAVTARAIVERIDVSATSAIARSRFL
jgi:hypothetical protein